MSNACAAMRAQRPWPWHLLLSIVTVVTPLSAFRSLPSLSVGMSPGHQ
jgi:hypothetical protein